MSGLEHHSTVDKGLKMKIKRTKNAAASSSSNKSDQPKHEIVKGGEKSTQGGEKGASGGSGDGQSSGPSTNGATAVEKVKHSDKDRSPKAKGIYRKERQNKEAKAGKSSEASGIAAVSTTLDAAFSQVSLEPKQAEGAPGKKEAFLDPYEFNAKVEDGIGVPVKKIKTEKDKVYFIPCP